MLDSLFVVGLYAVVVSANVNIEEDIDDSDY